MDSCVGRHPHLLTRHLRFVSLNNCLLMRSALMSQTRAPWYDRSPCELRTGDPATARPWVGGVLDSETNCGVHSAPRSSCVLSEAKQQVRGRRASPRLSRRRGAGFPLCSCTARCRPPAAASCLLTGFSPGIRRSLPPPRLSPPIRSDALAVSPAQTMDQANGNLLISVGEVLTTLLLHTEWRLAKGIIIIFNGVNPFSKTKVENANTFKFQNSLSGGSEVRF